MFFESNPFAYGAGGLGALAAQLWLGGELAGAELDIGGGKGYNGSNYNIGNINPKTIKPPGWTEKWEWRYPETNKPNVSPRWFDPNGGEWRWHAPDNYHSTGHWDYNSWDE